ncbi:MAG: hypothetical protein IPM77_04345 [Crocinitomicaceae bacterium]|nr:hypothetical protein [Crocinitomicaceae bacterium]
MCSIKNADCQIEYRHHFGIELIDPSQHWDTAVIKTLNVSTISAQRNELEVYSFSKNGKLTNFNLINDDYHSTEQTSIEYFENGHVKCLRTYLSYCHEDSPTCYDLLDDLTLLDTAQARKILPNLKYSSHEIFWKQTLEIEGHSIEVYFQLNDKGDIFYMKWHKSGELFWAANWSILTIPFHLTRGVILEFIQFNQVGSEWGENADNLLYVICKYQRYPKMYQK